MLSALELNGFKSFAERTRLEFPAGITVVVGPNGSGKSNVVDAIKWVLGSQSAKSLRGKEMSDVIFSGSKSRRQAGAAEVSLFLDNANGAIDHDAQQLQITRRVFRSGESEYLINRQPCRLRDVRDLLAAAGIATSGYAIIEQGRVDAVLQSSPKERRLIFEEAAGISRFRLKREEAARRLERVQQNLLRLGDVVEELQTRLKTVRAQATRARRYSETTERVRSLRIELGLEDWRTITARLDALQSDLAAELAIEQSLASQAAEAKAALVAIDERSELLARQLRETLSADATVRERLAQAESTRSSHLVRIDELEQEVVRLSHQLQTLASRAGDSQQLVATTADDLVASERLRAQLHQQVDALQQQMEGDETAAAEMRRETTRARDAVQEAERQVQQFGVERHSSEAKLHAVDVQREQRDSERQPLAERRERLAVDLRRATAELTRITAEVDESAGRLEAVHSELALHRAQLSAAQKRQAELAGRLTGARERIVVLEELEARLDGLAAGAREALRRARDEPDGPFRSVRGVVADLLQVDADTAPMIEAALGERANYLVVTETKSLAPVLADPQAWPARTTFLRLDVPHQASAVDRVELSNEPGVMGRADRFVEAPEDLSPLVRRLLARYWLVDTFTTAARLAAGLGQGLNFVTVAGEVMLADGTLAVGPRPSVGGMLSRRSELRALRDEIESMQTALADAEADSRRLEGLIDRGELATRQQTAAHANLVRVQAEVRVQSKAIAEHLEQIDVRLESLVAELETLDAQRGRLEHERDAAAASQQAAAEAVERRRSEIGELETCLAETTQRLAESQGKLNESRIELARAEQRVEGLRRQMEQLERDHAERDRAVAETRARAAECQAQRSAFEAMVGALQTDTTILQQQREQGASVAAMLESQLQAAGQERTAATECMDQATARLTQIQARTHAARLETQQWEQRRATLADRLRDDYQIELSEAAVAASPSECQLDRAAAEAEIAELRQRLSAAGPVNLESLAELEELESRCGSLVGQYDDLQQARTRLEQIVTQINGESRQLFVEAMTQIREHFQEIFRRLFGGGEADLVLEQEAGGDVLECGVSIVARPPGKQPRNISLLSGGERTLTCVALLLAIFRSRPSPFCILDEVDAALDEANIDRFVGLLKEFMATTQFVVVTHSKRTMTCGDTLHGVTMQESGVSKRVSVRFEDVGEDGRIRASALRAANEPQGAQTQNRAA